MNSALLSSKKMDWCTPQDFFDRLNEEFGFVLDAAATDKTAKCAIYYTPEMDGLSQSWDCGGAVFCNPPYGREIGKWVKKAYEEAQAGVPIVLLIPARKLFPRFYIPQSENSLYSWSDSVYGRRRKHRRSRALSFYAGDL